MTTAKKLKTSRFERVTNLALALMQLKTPTSLERLVNAIPGYPNNGDEATLRMAFERDKRILRDQGVAVETSESVTSRRLGYFIAKDALADGPAIDLHHDEIFQLAFALRIYRFENAAARSALMKLAPQLAPAALEQHVSSSLASFARAAVETRRPLRLTYKDRLYDIEPYSIVEETGDWLLVGRDQHFDGIRMRCFEAKHITSLLLGAARGFSPPPQFDPTTALSDPSLRFADEASHFPATSNRALDAGERFGRLMGILSFLAAEGHVSLSWLAALTQLRQSDLVAELEIAACCGVEPYTPDLLLDVVIDNEIVIGHGLSIFEQPFRLNEEEMVAAARAARSLLAMGILSEFTALVSAIQKCEARTHITTPDQPMKFVEWPSEWSMLVHLRVQEVLPFLKRLIVDEPKPAEKGTVDVVAFLADRRWQHVLLAALGDDAELIDDPTLANSGLSPQRQLAGTVNRRR